MRYLEPILCGSYAGYRLWFGDRQITEEVFLTLDEAGPVLKQAQEALRMLDKALKEK